MKENIFPWDNPFALEANQSPFNPFALEEYQSPVSHSLAPVEVVPEVFPSITSSDIDRLSKEIEILRLEELKAKFQKFVLRWIEFDTKKKDRFFEQI